MKTRSHFGQHFGELRSLAEARLVHEKLWAALAEGEALSKLTTWLLAVEGGAAVIVLSNIEALRILVGQYAPSVALLVLSVCLLLGILARWIDHTLQVNKIYRVREREAVDAILQEVEEKTRLSEAEIRGILDQHEDNEEGALRAASHEMIRRIPDLDEVQRKTQNEYLKTLGPIARHWHKKQADRTSPDDAHQLPRMLLRRQHMQWRLLLIQLVLLVFLVATAAVLLTVRSRETIDTRPEGPAGIEGVELTAPQREHDATANAAP